MTKHLRRTFLAPLVFAMALPSCADNVPVVSPSTLAVAPVYRIGNGDQLHITVYNEDRLTGDYQVDSNGAVSFPLLGPVPAADRTIGELTDTLRAGLLKGGYVNQPQVTVSLTQTAPFFIGGEVSRPGRYPTGEHITVLQAITMAGDYTYRANRTYVYLRRKGSDREVKVRADSNFQVFPGDVIRIGERQI